MTIKHLVISGVGPIMIQILGSIQHIERQKFINMNDIETIYGTSAGAIVGILICLKFDWETINDYIIKRPWQDVFQINAKSIFDSYSKKGIFDETIIKKCFKPLFDAKDINIDINLKEFYDLSKMLFLDIHPSIDKTSIMARIAVGLGFPIENADKIVKEAINFFLKEPDLEDFKKAIKKVNTIKH